jgi:hypothetical protein
LWIGTFVILRLSVLAPEDCPDVPQADLEASAVAAAAWIERAQGDDGRFVYEYDRATDRIAPGYNIVRHAGVTMSLYQLARAGHPEVLDTADAALAVMLDNLVPAGESWPILLSQPERLYPGSFPSTPISSITASRTS